MLPIVLLEAQVCPQIVTNGTLSQNLTLEKPENMQTTFVRLKGDKHNDILYSYVFVEFLNR